MPEQVRTWGYGFRIGLLCLTAGLLGGLVVGRHWDRLFASGGGFGQASPDGRHALSVCGNERQVTIALKSVLESDEISLSYPHSADDLYLRGRGNKVTWSDDSSAVEATWSDIVAGQKCRMWFRAVRGHEWRLKRVPLARDGITPLEPRLETLDTQASR